MSCWAATFTSTMAAGSLFSKLTDKIADKFTSFVCGISLPMTYDGGYLALRSPSPDQRRRCCPHPHCRSWSSSSSSKRRVAATTEADDADVDADEEDDEEDSVKATSSPRVGEFPAAAEEEESTTVPCLAFQSQHGYELLSLAGGNDDDQVLLRPVLGRRLLPSPRGGTVLATDVCYHHPCQLIDPFTGAAKPLPDLPLPRSDTEPISCAREEPRPPHHRASARATDDGLAWDWSPRGVMVARGDTAFFLPHGADEWTPVHQSWRGAPMTVNHRGGKFFLLELGSLATKVVDAATLGESAVVQPPPDVEDIDAAYLAPSSDDVVFLLVHRAGDRRGRIVSEVYRARLGRRRPPQWRRVADVGERAVFVDRAHGFTVRAGPQARRNHMYVLLSYHGAGATAVEYDVGVVNLRWPERQERMRLDAGEVDRAWGWQPHWIVPKDRRDDCQ